MTPQRIYIITALAWLFILAIDAAQYLARAFATLPSSDVYADGLGFQLAAYALTRGSYFVLALVCLLLAAFVLFRRKQKFHGSQA